MTIHFGEVPSGSVLPVHFGSYNSAGASVALTGLAITDVEIYKGTTVTQRASDAGVVLIDTDGIDIDGITGANGFSIDTGDNTDAGFYAVGSFFNVWVSAVTIDAQVVNFLAATFSLSAARSVAGVPEVDATHYRGNAIPATAVSGIPDINVAYYRDAAASFSIAGIPAVEVLGISSDGPADIRAAVGLASANLDTQLAALPTAIENATELLDQAAGVETGLTVRQWLRFAASALFGKASGLATTTAIYRDFGDTKDRLTATVDSDGNRSAITRDAT